MAQAQVHIFYGSQSGTSECFAEELSEEAAAKGIVAEAVDLSAFDPASFAACKIIIMIVSTYGDGEPTENAIEFHKWASHPQNDGALNGSFFCVMGLGDMNYTQFNNMGKLTDGNLERLGGTRIYNRGVGDDSQDIAADFNAWKEGGLWTSLQDAIVKINAQGGFQPKIAATEVAPAFEVKVEINVFFGYDEADGAAKDVCEELTGMLRAKGLSVVLMQSLTDRKATESVKKMAKHSLAIIVVDVGPDGMCAAGRKLVRNMQLEVDPKSLADKAFRFVTLTVASSRCNNSAGALKDANSKASGTIDAAFERVGATAIVESVPRYVDAGVEDVPPVLASFCDGIASAAKPVAVGASSGTVQSKPMQTNDTDAASLEQKKAPEPVEEVKYSILSTGPTARKAFEDVIPSGRSIDDANLNTLRAAAQQRNPVVFAVESKPEGGLSDGTLGFCAQLRNAPLPIKTQLKQFKLRYALVFVTNADANKEVLAPVEQALIAIGANCAYKETFTTMCNLSSIGDIFCSITKSAVTQAVGGQLICFSNPSGPAAGSFGTPILRLAATVDGLPAEVAGEPADVLARFYFEAERAKVLKVRELRQSPDAREGLSTAEVELEAARSLKSYALGGTLTLLPENDSSDVAAILPLLGLQEADLTKALTFVFADGSGSKIKRPFPTPCTVGEALSRYCDLGRAPTKKMLTAIQPKVDQEASQRLGTLLADGEALKIISDAPLCCRMHEFWSLFNVKHIDPCDFLLHCPRQKAREYTIASSPKASPDCISFCVSVTSHELPSLEPLVQRLQKVGALSNDMNNSKLPDRGRFFGVCSRWITSKLKVGDVVLVKQRASPFHLPEKDVPIIMVGAGAGVAPFRGFWEELRRGPQTAPAALFFGCRHPGKDWIYKDEMQSVVKLGGGCAALQRVQAGPKRPLTCLFTAFSRPDAGKQGRYVQEDLRAQTKTIKNWIESMGGYVYVCGSTAMGTAVLESLAEAVEGGASAVDALRKEGRIVAEMWG